MKASNILEIVDRRTDPRKSNVLRRLPIWKAVGGIALLGLAAMVITVIPDIKRYIKISMM